MTVVISENLTTVIVTYRAVHTAHNKTQMLLNDGCDFRNYIRQLLSLHSVLFIRHITKHDGCDFRNCNCHRYIPTVLLTSNLNLQHVTRELAAVLIDADPVSIICMINRIPRWASKHLIPKTDPSGNLVNVTRDCVRQRRVPWVRPAAAFTRCWRTHCRPIIWTLCNTRSNDV